MSRFDRHPHASGSFEAISLLVFMALWALVWLIGGWSLEVPVWLVP